MSASQWSNEVSPQLPSTSTNWARLSQPYVSKVLQPPKAPVAPASTRSKPFKFPDPRVHPDAANWYTFDPDLYKNNDSLVVSSPSPDSELESQNGTTQRRSMSSPQLIQPVDGFSRDPNDHGYTHLLDDSQSRRHSLQIAIPSGYARLSTSPTTRVRLHNRSPNSPYARPVERPHHSSTFGTTGPSHITLAKPNSTRSPLACNACRKRKVRCVVHEEKQGGHKVRVCERCSRMKLECVWGEERRKKGHKEKDESDPQLDSPSSRTFIPSKFSEQIRQDTVSRGHTAPFTQAVPNSNRPIHFLADSQPGTAELSRPSSGETTSIIYVPSSYPPEGISITNSPIPSVSSHSNLTFSSPASNITAPTLVSPNFSGISLDQSWSTPSVSVPVDFSAQACGTQGSVSTQAHVTQWPEQNPDEAFFVPPSNVHCAISNLAITENVIGASAPGPMYSAQGMNDSTNGYVQNHAQGWENVWGQGAGAPSTAPSEAPSSSIHSASKIFPNFQEEFYAQFYANQSNPNDCSMQMDLSMNDTAFPPLAVYQDPFWPAVIGYEPGVWAPNYLLQPSGIQCPSDQSEWIADLQHEGLMNPVGNNAYIGELYRGE